MAEVAAQEKAGDAAGKALTPVRIFVASPGDVGLERIIAREVIEQVGSERRFRDRLALRTVAWDQPGGGVAMEATLTPQAAIDKGLRQPRDCDLVVVILWSRIGTPLPSEYTKADGSAYLSGTEWEYHNAVEGHGASGGRPTIWLYRRDEEPVVGMDDQHKAEKEVQWQRLKVFLRTLNNAGGLNPYAAADDFRQQFSAHLRDFLEQTLAARERTAPAASAGAAQPAVPPAPPRWTGVPYPGLEVFRPEQAPIFFGRGPEIDQLLNQLSGQGTRLLAVVGVSGAGKSSLVAAGLLPCIRRIKRISPAVGID